MCWFKQVTCLTFYLFRKNTAVVSSSICIVDGTHKFLSKKTFWHWEDVAIDEHNSFSTPNPTEQYSRFAQVKNVQQLPIWSWNWPCSSPTAEQPDPGGGAGSDQRRPVCWRLDRLGSFEGHCNRCSTNLESPLHTLQHTWSHCLNNYTTILFCIWHYIRRPLSRNPAQEKLSN